MTHARKKRILSGTVIVLFILVSFASIPRSAHAAATLVQQDTKTFTTGSRSVYTSDSITTTTGNLVVLTFEYQGTVGGPPVSTVVGGGVTSWTKAVSQIDAINDWESEIWYGVSTGGTGTVVVTMTASKSSSVNMNVSEWSGMAASPFVAANSKTATTGHINTNSVTPTAGTDVVLTEGFSAQSNITSDAPGYTPYTGMAATGSKLGGYQIVTGASGSYAADTTWSGTRYSATIAAFLVASGPSNTTTLGNGSNPSNATLAPGGSATMADAFTLQTNTSTDSVTAVTVGLGSGAHNGISSVEITSDDGTTVYGSSSNPSSDSPVVTLSTPISVTTSSTQYKIRITPLSHASMPVPPGATYTATPTIVAYAVTNTTAGSDSSSATITIDNASPADVTSSSVTAGDTQNVLAWTNPADGDFTQTIVLRRTSSAVTDTPVEGTTYSVGNTIGSSSVACATASTTCTDTSLTNSTAYYYKIFTKDSHGNYSAGATPTGSPATPMAVEVTLDHYRWRADDGSLSGATSLANEDTAYTNAAIGDRVRLRFLVENTGDITATAHYILRQKDDLGGSWSTVPDYGAAGGNDPWVMDLTSHYANAVTTSDLAILTDPTGTAGADLNGYSYNRSITIDHTKVPNTDQSNFPVLVSGTYSYLATTGNGGKVENSSGYDVTFTSDSGCDTPLDWETEKYVASTGEVDYWVKIPTVSHTSDTVFYMCYGDPGIASDQSTPTSVWDSNFAGVYHLPDGTTLSANDSTSNGNDGTNNNVTATAGKIDGAGSFNGTNANINADGLSSVIAGGNLTFEFWATFASTYSSGSAFGFVDRLGDAPSDNDIGVSFGQYSPIALDGKLHLFWYNSGFQNVASTQSSWTANVPYHVVVTFSNSAVNFYINGVLDNSVTGGTRGGTSLSTHFNFGSDVTGQPLRGFSGTLDELRVSGIVRSADWVATEYANQSSPSTFYTVGSETVGASPVTFITGNAMSSTGRTPSISLPTGDFTEIEYSIRSTSAADAGATYDFDLSSDEGITFTNIVMPAITLTNTINVENGGATGGYLEPNKTPDAPHTGGGQGGGGDIDGGGGGGASQGGGGQGGGGSSEGGPVLF